MFCIFFIETWLFETILAFVEFGNEVLYTIRFDCLVWFWSPSVYAVEAFVERFATVILIYFPSTLGADYLCLLFSHLKILLLSLPTSVVLMLLLCCLFSIFTLERGSYWDMLRSTSLNPSISINSLV